jgi:hypothetical protein
MTYIIISHFCLIISCNYIIDNCRIIRNFVYICYNITKKGEWAYEGKTEE